MAEAFPEKLYVRCLSCNFESYNEKDFLNHVRIHQYEKDFRIPCILCPQVLKTFPLYKKHRRKHAKGMCLKRNLTQTSQHIYFGFVKTVLKGFKLIVMKTLMILT